MIDKNTLQEMLYKQTGKEIAQKLGVSSAAVSLWIKKYELQRNIDDKYLNKQFGMLRPVERLEYKISEHTAYRCKCLCGKEINISCNNLKNAKSCGCTTVRGRQHGRYKGYEDISGILWRRIQDNAKKRNLEINITPEILWNLFIKQNKKCALTNLDIHLASSSRYDKNTASLDRIDSNKGYIEDNIQWVHKSINAMKLNLKQEEFIEFCHLVSIKHRGYND